MRKRLKGGRRKGGKEQRQEKRETHYDHISSIFNVVATAKMPTASV